ncbi:MAG: sulfite exporter TauE/SafE family protein [Candidatus Omnitrophica bacterium]|nr:sulfite exporter TauE/SafE family protein [Candidatus Omnitrophota bacterium]MDD5488490.1 sulfite exporter TauE/SafE family protein [Candidatus Omnitrophota bacterium]
MFLVVVGLLAGVVSGLIGIGGGIIVVPALIYIFGYNQHMAQGTTLAMLVPPIGILAAWTYYRNGHVNIIAAVLLCLGFVIGGLLGAKLAGSIPADALRKLFGACLMMVSIYMIVK